MQRNYIIRQRYLELPLNDPQAESDTCHVQKDMQGMLNGLCELALPDDAKDDVNMPAGLETLTWCKQHRSCGLPSNAMGRCIPMKSLILTESLTLHLRQQNTKQINSQCIK